MNIARNDFYKKDAKNRTYDSQNLRTALKWIPREVGICRELREYTLRIAYSPNSFSSSTRLRPAYALLYSKEAREVFMTAFRFLSLILLMTGAWSAAKAENSNVGFESRELRFQPPSSFVSLDLFAPRETLILEKKCLLEDWEASRTTYREDTNTLEFGLRVLIPQAIPAESQWYSRYTCARPGVKP